MHGRNRIRELRKAAGLSLGELALEVEVDPSTLSRWETGGLKRFPPHDKLARLAERFGVTVPFLMGFDDGNGGQALQEAA